MDVILLAGGRCSDELREATGCALRAELPVGGRPMAAVVAEAVKEGAGGGRLISVGFEFEGADLVPAGENFIGSVRNGLEATTAGVVFMTAADLPFVTAQSVRSFIELCGPSLALSYPIVPVAACERRFPGMKRTSLKLREGKFTGGNVAVANRELLLSIFPTLELAYANRKRPLRLARQVGIGTLLSVAIGQAIPALLPLASLERRVGRFLGADVRAVITDLAELGADIDTLEQYLHAVRMLDSSNAP